MRFVRLVRMLCAVAVVGLLGTGLPVDAQDDPAGFAPGDRVLVVVDALPVHVQPDANSGVAENLQTNMTSQIVTTQESGDGTVWYYLRDNAYGWVPSLVAGESPLMHYTDALLEQRIAEATAAIQANPADAAAYAARGMGYFSTGDHIAAIADYTQAITLDPTNGTLYDFRGKMYLNIGGGLQPALIDLQQAIRYGPVTPNTYNRMGIAYERLGQYDQAVSSYDQAIALEPGYGLLYGNKAVAFDRLWMDDEEMAMYNRAIETDPYLSLAYVNRGLGYQDYNLIYEAFNDFNQAIKVDPYYSNGYARRGGLYCFELADFESAFQDVNRALELNPGDINALTNRGACYVEIRELTLGIADLERVVSIDPAHEPAWYNLGRAYALTGQYERAIESYNLSMESGVFYQTIGHLYRGQVYLAMGDLENAMQDLVYYAMIVDPSNGPDYVVVGKIMAANALLHQGDFFGAETFYREANTVDPDLVRTYSTWLADWVVTPDREDVLADLEDRLSRDPDNAELNLQVANMYMEFGRWNEAIGSYKRYSELVDEPGFGFPSFYETLKGLYAAG
jgi:tetratricopeptide (TPR) repeat protein